MATFKAIVIEKADSGQTVALKDFDEADLMEGDVDVRVEWSTVNYKDGLAVTGKAPVVRRWPMIAGIDLAGTVEKSSHPDWKPGDKVILNGWGLGETHLGAYAQKARVKGEWLVRLPATMSDARRHGDRHRRLHRDARGDGAGEARHHARPRAAGRDRRRRRRRLGRDRAAGASSATRSPPRPAGRRRRTTSSGSAPPRSSSARNCPARRARSRRSAGPAASIRSARPRSPMCCR